MDSDKDKPQQLPENPPSSDHPEPKNDDNNNNNNDSNDKDKDNNKSKDEQQSEKPEKDQDLPQEHTDISPTAPKASSSDDDETKPETLPESEIKDEQDAPPEVPLEESPPPALDLEKVSEEVDQYISALSNSKQGDDDESSTTPLPDVPIFIEQFAILVEAKVADYDSSDSPVKWSRLTEEDSASFLEAVTRLSSISKSLSQFATDFKYAPTINRIGGVLQRSVAYLEEEFRSLLEEYKIQDPPPQTSSNNGNETKPDPEPEQQENPPPPESESEPAPPQEEKQNTFPGYSEEILSDLIKLAKVMINVGHEAEVTHVYFVARRNASEESLHKQGFEKHSIDDVQKMQWESLDRAIGAWNGIFRQWVTVHFPAERRLSDAVFSDHPSVSVSLFCSLSQAVILQLLNFAGAVALTKRGSEKLFRFLDVYLSLKKVLPEVEDLFPEEWMNEIKTEASMIKGRLGEGVISIFLELEGSIKADAAKTPVPGGAIHPLTRYVMNYLKVVGDYKETLEQIFREHQKIERADSATGSDFNYNAQAPQQSASASNEAVKQSPFQAQLVKLMELLDANLDAKSKLYKDHALSSIFMMNNGRYILQKVRGSPEINSLMGDSWSRKRSTELRQYHKGYQRETWGKLLHCLHPEGLMTNGKVSKPVLKERFKSFNATFDEIHKTQSNWVVSDEQLQSELRVSISNMVIPAYRSFLGRHSQVFTPGRQTEKYVKYQPEDIETYIDELFDGNAAPAGRKRQ